VLGIAPIIGAIIGALVIAPMMNYYSSIIIFLSYYSIIIIII